MSARRESRADSVRAGEVWEWKGLRVLNRGRGILGYTDLIYKMGSLGAGCFCQVGANMDEVVGDDPESDPATDTVLPFVE